jgi:hypothetical protein
MVRAMCANATEQIVAREIAVFADNNKEKANGMKREQRPLILVADEERIRLLIEKVIRKFQ